jgi:hypothetical protein
VYLKKLRRAEGGGNFFEVFRVKNHDFTPKNHMFSNFRAPPPPPDPPLEVEFESCVECNYFNDRARKVRKTFPEGCKTKPGIVFRYCKTNILQLLFDNFSDVTFILVSLLLSFRRYYHHSFALLSSSLFFQRRFSFHKSSMHDKITHDRICC